MSEALVRDHKATNAPSFIVGLGASAGGLEALERYFEAAPVDSGGAYVVVMHLARDFRSVLDELLARHTRMAVFQIEDGDTIEANSVYVIQPATEVEVAGDRFKVTPRSAMSATGRISSIDVLLQSIASSWRERGAAVILSGSGSDGAHGVVAIHAAGGLVFAQSPESAKFDSMPIAAISTNSVSGVDTPELLAQMVVDSILLPRITPQSRKATSDEAALQQILAAMIGTSQIDASQYTQSTFERRVQRRMREVQVKSLQEYAELVQTDRNEARSLSATLLIGVTDFFRDESAFACLARIVAPDLIRRAAAERRPIRIWVPGCASGEEAYSLAMLFAEALADFSTQVEIQIFATDVHKGFLAEAARGEYAEERLANVSETRRRSFFTRTASGTFQIDAKLRKSIVFAPHDVLVDPPFTRLDLVSCRNLLIYFSIEAQQRVINSLAYGLLEKGYLFLGSSETVGAHRESFEFVDARRRVFRRTRSSNRTPAFNRTIEPLERFNALGTPTSTSRRSVKSREAMLQPAYAALLKQFAPASLLISSERELLHTFGNARRFLRAPEGVARLDITEMCDPALRTPLMTGIDRALRHKSSIHFSRIELTAFPEKGLVVDLAVEPLPLDADNVFALVMIEELDLKATSQVMHASAPIDDHMTQRVAELEIEIMRTREALQSTIEEIETANEELQATNEELMSSNEELQSTNEELSSLNEELHSVNAEHFRQNDELVRLTRDFDALLHATEIGVVFFDEALNIRRFTRLVAELFQFAESDIGRALRTFRVPFVDFEIEPFLLRIMRAGTIEEVEVHDDQNRLWLLRGAGYPDQKGVVLSIIGLARPREGDILALGTRERLFALADPFAGDPLIIAAPTTGRIEYANRSAWNRFGIPEIMDGELKLSRLTPEWGDSTWLNWLSSIGPGMTSKRLDIQIIDKAGKLLAADVLASVVVDDDRLHAIIRISENRERAIAMLELKERARNFATSNRELEQFASVVAHDLRAPLRHLNQFAGYLLDDLGEAASGSVREYLEIIQSSSINMSGMIERLLDYARIGAGEPSFAAVPLQECMEQAMVLLHGEIAAANAVIKIVRLPSVRGDRLLLVRLFQNLLMNALTYRSPDRVPQIEVSARADNETVVLAFADNGQGVDPAHAETIFRMFSRLQPETDHSGHGLGLAICRRICDIHGGKITLDPTASVGARFLVELPRAKSRAIRTEK